MIQEAEPVDSVKTRDTLDLPQGSTQCRNNLVSAIGRLLKVTKYNAPEQPSPVGMRSEVGRIVHVDLLRGEKGSGWQQHGAS